jgi:transposase-like protein
MGARGPKSKFIDEACPNKDCGMHGQVGKGNIAGNGTYQTRNGRVRKYVCRSCGTTFCGRKNTAFFDFKTKDEKVLLALKMIIKGMSMRAVAEVLETKLDTVRKWVNRAAEHTEEVNAVLLKEMKVSKIELDELWTFVQKKQFREWSSLRTMERGSG